MDKQLIGVIIGGSIGLFGAALAQIVSHYLTIKREKEKRLYEEIIKQKEDVAKKSKEFKDYIMGSSVGGNIITKPTVILGSNNVLSSFNKVKMQFDEETANVIQQIAEIVEISKNAEAVELFEAFNEEISKPEPKKTLLKTFWNNLSSLLPDLSITVSIVEKVMKIIDKK